MDEQGQLTLTSLALAIRLVVGIASVLFLAFLVCAVYAPDTLAASIRIFGKALNWLPCTLFPVSTCR
jgi:hypothetical protein